MSINKFLTYFVYIFNVLTIILILISFYCLFIQFLDLFLYQNVSDFIVYNVSDTYTRYDNNIREDNTNNTSSLCSCSSCTCSNPSVNVSSAISTLVNKYKNVGKRHIY